MQKHISLRLFVVMISLVAAEGRSQDIVIKAENNGRITWEGTKLASTASVLWAASLTEPGRTNWHRLTNIVIRYPQMASDVPVFFRVVGIVETNLVAWYPLNTDAKDASGHGVDLANSGGISLPSDHINGCFRFAVGTYASQPDIDISQLPCSISFWTKFNYLQALGNTNGGAKVIHNWGLGGNGDKRRGAVVDYNDGQTLRMAMGDTPMPEIGAVSTGQWYHVVLVYQSSTNACAYLNGVMTCTATGTLGTASTTLYLGKDPGDWWGNFNGYLDDVRVYNRVVSSAEVQCLYSLGETNLVAWYPLNADAKDASGHGVDLANSGGISLPSDHINGCFRFAVGTYASQPDIDISQLPCSISFWTKFNYLQALGNTNGGAKVIHNWGLGGNGDKRRGAVVDYNDGQTLRMAMGDTPMPEIGAVSTGQWYHVVLVYQSSTNACAYLNGVMTCTATGTLGTASTTLYLGKDPGDWWGNFNGYLDDVRVYNRVVSSAEVRCLYSMGQ